LLLAAGLTVFSGCAESLAPKFVPNAAPGEKAVAEAIAAPAPRSESSVLVGITEDPMRLVAWDLGRSAKLWEVAIDAVSAPLIAGNTVVLRERGGVVARDLATGARRAELDSEGDLVSADGIGDRVVVSIGYGKGSPRGTVMLLEKNSVRWARTLTQPIGRVALVGDQVLVPWGTQRLTVLAASDGSELARWSFSNMTMGQARIVGRHAYVGQHGLLRVDPDLPAHTNDAVTLIAPEKRTLPAQPPFLRDGYAAMRGAESAENRLELVWQPAIAEGTTGAEQDLLALRFYRVLFGLSASSDTVRFVQVFDHDLVAAEMHSSGLWLADALGTVRVLDANGNTLTVRELGMPLLVAALRPGTAPVLAPANAEAKAQAPAPLSEQLIEAVRLNDERLVLARAYAVEQIARDPSAAITQRLIELCALREQPESVRLSACKAVASRSDGSQHVLAALRQRASFLENTPAPPAGALAQAAATMQLKQAGPLLLLHAEDPATQSSDLAAIFRALEQLDQRNALPMLERFVRLHHAEPPGSELSDALKAAFSALGTLRYGGARPTLEDVASDGLSEKGVRDKARAMLAVIDTPPAPKTADAKDTKAAKVVEAPAARPEPEVQTDPRAYALDMAAVQSTLKPLQYSLERCVAGDPAKPPSARVAMIVAGDGSIEGLLVTPSSLQACMEPLLRKARFPETRLGRQHLSHTVYAPAEKAAEVPQNSASEPKPAAPRAAKTSPAKKAGSSAPAAKPAPVNKP
jgi:hypothetical protein